MSNECETCKALKVEAVRSFSKGYIEGGKRMAEDIAEQVKEEIKNPHKDFKLTLMLSLQQIAKLPPL